MRKILTGFYRGQALHYFGGALGAGLSLAIFCFPGQSAKLVALTGVSLSVGYAGGIAACSQRTKGWASRAWEHWERQTQAVQAELDNHKRSLAESQQQADNLQRQLKTTSDEANLLRSRTGEIVAKLSEYQTRFEEALKTDVAVIEQRLKAELDHQKREYYEQSLAKIKKYNSEHRHREQQWYSELLQKDEELEKLQSERAGEIEAIQSHYKAQWTLAAQRYEELIAEYDRVIGAYGPELREIQAVFRQQMTSVIGERDRIYAQLERYHDAKRFTGSTKADINGNRLIDFFLGEGIMCDADRCESHFEFDEIWIRPRVHTVEVLEKYASAIHLQFELLKPPEFKVDSGCIRAVLRTHTKEKNPTSKTIDEQPENWLEQIAKQSNHYRISAPTDSGKSVFLDNLIACLQLIHGQMNLTLLDPKYPFTDWQSHTPDYKGFEQCLAGMHELGSLIDARLSEAALDVDAGKPIRDYPAHLFAIDELEIMIDEARAKDDGAMRGKTSLLLARLLRKGLKLGRGLKSKPDGQGIIVAYVTQSPLCSRINLNRDDFDNSTNIWMGENIPRALSEELSNKLSDKQLAYLTNQYQLRKDQGELYFALVKTPKSAFIAPLPVEGYYSQLLATSLASSYQKLIDSPLPDSQQHPELESSTDKSYSNCMPGSGIAHNPQNQPTTTPVCLQLTCPICQSSATKKSGKTRGIQYYQCKDCKKRFRG